MLIGLLVLSPLAYLFIRAFEGGGFAGTVSAIFSVDTLFYGLRSLGLAAVVAVASVLLSIGLAWFTLADDLPFSRIFTILVVCPLAVPCYVGAAVYIGVFSSSGLLGGVVESLGLQPGWFNGFWASAFVLTMFIYPLAYLPIRAGLRRVDRSAYEAARMLGRSRLMAIRAGVLPQLRSSIVSGGLLVGLYTLGEFGAVSLLRCNTFTRVIYVQYESAFDRTGAAVSSLALVGLIALVLLLGRWMRGNSFQDRSGRSVSPLKWSIGHWRWGALAICLCLVGLAIVIPLISLFAWWGRGSEAIELASGLIDPLLNSLILALSAGAIVLVLSIPIALLVTRHPSRLASMIDRMSHIGFGLPGLVIGLSLVFVALRLIPALYQSWFVLLLGYCVLFLALAIGPIRSGLEQASLTVDEAARTLGAGWARRFRCLVLPVIRPGLFGAFLLVFISTSKELPCTLLLSPAGTHTLSTRVWQYTDEAMYAEASMPALALIFLSGLLVAILTWREELLEK
ncbi:MAG: iron ABC transporter permease [Phycisphaerae bacterium]|nr:iron ABC transporter permease [Phycisphaerae bacterium]